MASLSFWGGAGTVTGSKHLLQTSRARILVECGIFQGLKELRERNWQRLPFDPRSLDAVIITHAHMDHTGYLPRLVAQGFHGPVYCSRATATLLKILLPDAARLQEEEAEYRNRHHLSRHAPALPLYTEQDARAALKRLCPIADSAETSEIAPGIRARFFNAGHILGSRFVLVEAEASGKDQAGCRILFSGDLGRSNQPILRDLVPPPACDYLIVESTYGNRLHSAQDPKETLARIIVETAARGGTLLIPAFAVGRTQELLYSIRELEDEGRIPILPVHADSPMAAAATQAYSQMSGEQDAAFTRLRIARQHPLCTRSMLTATTRAESKRINDASGPRIILSASGMMTGGRVLHHARRILPNENATLLFVGYEAAGTTGRRILDGEPQVKIHKEWVPVRCHVERIEGFSSHPDWKEVLRWLEDMPVPLRQVFVTHGEPEAAQAMRDHIIERFQWKTSVPEYGDVVEL